MIILDFFRGRFNRGATGFRVSWRLIYSGPIRREGISTQSPSDGPSAKLGFSGLAASNTLAGQNQPRNEEPRQDGASMEVRQNPAPVPASVRRESSGVRQRRPASSLGVPRGPARSCGRVLLEFRRPARSCSVRRDPAGVWEGRTADEPPMIWAGREGGRG